MSKQLSSLEKLRNRQRMQSKDSKEVVGNKADKKKRNLYLWIALYRANMEIFIEHYLGIKLFTFQKILIHLMDKYPYFMFIATRGIGKSWITAVYACARCILYPNQLVVIAAGSKKQAALIVTHKIGLELQNASPNLKKEIKKINTSAQETYVEFHNGSRIDVIAATDKARGYRANLIIYDEFRLIEDDVINKIIRPFKNHTRNVGFRHKPEYAGRQDLIEMNKEVFLSSAYFKSHPMYKRFMSYTEDMCSGDPYKGVVGLSYTTPIEHGMLKQEEIDTVKNDETFTEIDWVIEYEALFYGLSENAFFSYEHIANNRTLQKPVYPAELLDVIGVSKKDRPKKSSTEIRIMGYDVALMGTKNGKDNNDNAVLTNLRCIPEATSFRRQLVDVKAYSGLTSTEQAKNIKRYFYENEMDYIVLDCRGNGMAVYDELIKITYDDVTDKEFPAWAAYNDDDLKARAPKDALPLIYAFHGTSEINHKMATHVRDLLQRGRIELLEPMEKAIDFLNDKYGYDTKDTSIRQQLSKPYVETEMLGIEMMNLEYELKNGYIRVYESHSGRKDRYVSFGMANYLARQLESDHYKKGKKADVSKFCKVYNRMSRMR